MKKVLSIFMIMLVISSLHAISTHKTLGMDITAYNGDYHSFAIEGVYGSLSDSVGMPFDLTRSDVAYVEDASGTAGRQIGQWAVHSNYTPVNIIIDADPLTPVGSDSNTSAKIDYVLFFPYSYVDQHGGTVTGFMKVDSGTEYQSRYQSDGSTNAISADLAGSGLDTDYYPVRFMLASNVDISDRNTYPSGSYSANVHIRVEGS